MEKGPSSGQQQSNSESTCKLFLVETVGSRYSNGLVFTVLAEDHLRAEALVLEWIKHYGEDSDEIDTIRAVVSRDVRAIVNVGTKLFTS